jgi:hypothetical protein
MAPSRTERTPKPPTPQASGAAAAALALTAALALASAGCTKSERAGDGQAAVEPSTGAAESAAIAPAADAAVPGGSSTTLNEEISAAKRQAVSGSFEQAAAQLLHLRASGQRFNAQDAAAYRRALEEAYSKAVEAAAKGDPHGKAAMQMIRAAGAF